MRKHNQRLSDMMCQGTKGVVHTEAERHYGALVQSTQYVLVSNKIGDYAETLKYAQGMQWRMLRGNGGEDSESGFDEHVELEKNFARLLKAPYQANAAVLGPFISEAKMSEATGQCLCFG